MSFFDKISRYFSRRLLNGGTVLIVMGAGWLYLWLVPWYRYYIGDPRWGHNYVEAGAFLVLGLAYFNRRFITDALAFIATLLIIPAALELVSHSITAFTGLGLLVFTVIDMIVERKRSRDLFQPGNPRLSFWLKKHLPRFSLIMLSHISIIFFVVRLPSGTYETDTVTKVFDGMLIILLVFLLLEDFNGIVNSIIAKRAAFFWGMVTTIVALIMLSDQPETYPVLAITVVIMIIGFSGLRFRQSPLQEPQRPHD